MEYCYVVYWEEECLKKICVDSQPVDQEFPDAELVPIAKVLCSVEDAPWPVSIRNCSPLLLRVFSEGRRDSRQFIVNEPLMVMCCCSVSDRHTRMCSAWWN